MKIETLFDWSASRYDATEEVRFREQTSKTLESARRYLHPGDVVLDYGCATGTKALALSGQVSRIRAIDISSKMIDLAGRKATESKVENVEFVRATIFDERFRNGSFDAVLAFNVLHLLEDDLMALRRIVELLRPGGLLISTTPCLGEKMEFRTRLEFSFFLLLIRARLFPPLRRYRFGDLEDLVAAAGLQVVAAEKSFHQLSGQLIVARKE